MLTTLIFTAVFAFATTARAGSVNTLIIEIGVSVNPADGAISESIGNRGAHRAIRIGDVIRGAFHISRINSTTTDPGVGTQSRANKWSRGFSLRVVSLTEVDWTPDGDASEQDWTIVFGIRGSRWIATNSSLVAHPNTVGALAGSPANFELTLLSNLGLVAASKHPGRIEALTGSVFDSIGNPGSFGAGGSSTVSGGALQNGQGVAFQARDETTLPVVALPVPQAVWLGLALIGLIGFRSIRRRPAVGEGRST
jgi:hypothetical protein